VRAPLSSTIRRQEEVNEAACVDASGQPLAVGDEVRILCIPQWLTNDLPEEDAARLKTQEGKVMRVLEVDAQGYIWFGTDNAGRWFCLRPAEVLVVQL
jgi:hypothetical protein